MTRPARSLSNKSSPVENATSPKEQKRKRNLSGIKTAGGQEVKNPDDEVLLVDDESKWHKWWTRGYTTVLMIGGFSFIIYMGHLALAGLVFLLQCLAYREFLKIRRLKMQLRRKRMQLERDLPYSLIFDIWMFISVQYYMYGSFLFTRFKEFFFDESKVGPFISSLAVKHSVVSFSLLCIGWVGFVLSLRKGFYRIQFQMMAWTMCAMVVLIQGSFPIHNILSGMIWFLLPASLIICNDITAFIWGFFFGHTPLIQLSPKKTWEGFIGAFFSTLVFGFFFSYFLVQYPYFTCPKIDFLVHPGSACDPEPSFLLHTYHIANFHPSIKNFIEMAGLSKYDEWTLYPIQLHALVLATFASIIAPFGGFMASGFKRAFDLKDFGDIIPGHGGIIDRMDCQLLMMGFAYVYQTTFIQRFPLTVANVMGLVFSMPKEDQVEILHRLQTSLSKQVV